MLLFSHIFDMKDVNMFNVKQSFIF